jgi:hypothetical protein
MNKIYERNKNESSYSEDNIILYHKKLNSFINLKEKENKIKFIGIMSNPFTINKTTGSGLNKDRNIIESVTSGILPEPDLTFDNYTSTLLNMMQNEVFESGFSTESEKFVKSLIEQNQQATMTWLNGIFNRNIDSPKIIVGILHIISHFDYKKVYPNGQTIAMAAAFHKNVEVKDYAVKAFENWDNVDSLPILKNMDCQEQWLQEYIDELINDLEKGVAKNVIFG